jgi:hypothetical protein
MNPIHEEIVTRVNKIHPEYGSLFVELIFHDDKLSKARIFDRTEIVLPAEKNSTGGK